MSRLTKEEILKFPQTTYGRALGKTIASKVMNELLQYKDLEEQLGCPLEVVIKAIKNGIWFINTKNELEYIDEALAFNTKRDSGKFVFDNCCYYCQNIEKSKCNEIYLEDYKKTWWLKEDKSE